MHPLAGLLHDAVLLWALAINHTVRRGENPKDGVAVTRNIQRVLVKGSANLDILLHEVRI